jgi:hypothetical protein
MTVPAPHFAAFLRERLPKGEPLHLRDVLPSLPLLVRVETCRLNLKRQLDIETASGHARTACPR